MPNPSTKFIIQAQNMTDATFKKVESNIKGLEFGAKALKTTLAGVGLAVGGIAAIGVASVKAFEELKGFDRNINDLGKVTERSLEGIREEILLLPDELGRATDLVAGYYQTISAGHSDPLESIEFLTGAAKASKAAHVEQGEVVKALSKVMAGYRGEIESVTQASDLLFGIEKAGQTSFEELVPVIGDLAAMAKNLGIKSVELGGALSLVTQTAGSTSQAATQVKATMLGLFKPTEKLTKLFESLGIKSGEALVKQKGFAGALELIQKEAKAANIPIGKLFESSEALIGISGLAANNFEEFRKKTKEVGDQAGSTKKNFDAWTKTIEGISDALDSKFNKVMLSFGTKVAPAFLMGMEDISDFLDQNEEQIVSGLEAIGSAAVAIAKGMGEVLKLASLRSISTTFSEGMELAKAGIIDFDTFVAASFTERQNLVDGASKDLLEIQKKAAENVTSAQIKQEKEWTELLRTQSNERINILKDESKKRIESLLIQEKGFVSGLFSGNIKKQIENELRFLKIISPGGTGGVGGLGAATSFQEQGRGVVGQLGVISPLNKEVVKTTKSLEKMWKFVDNTTSGLSNLDNWLDQVVGDVKGIDLSIDETSLNKFLDDVFKKTPAGKDPFGTDFLKDLDVDFLGGVELFGNHVGQFGSEVLMMLGAIQAFIDLPVQIVDSLTGIIDSISNFPDTITTSLSSLGESAADFLTHGFGKAERDRRAAEEVARREFFEKERAQLESDWAKTIAKLTLSPLEFELKTLNDRYDDQFKRAVASGASIKELTRARSLEIIEINKANTAIFDNLLQDIESFRRDLLFDVSEDPLLFLQAELKEITDALENFSGTNEEQVDLFQDQFGILKEILTINQQQLSVAEDMALNFKESRALVDETIASLATNQLADASVSVDFFQRRFEQLETAALGGGAEDVSAFVAFQQDFIDFMGAAGFDSAEIINQSITSLTGVSDILGDLQSEQELLIAALSENTSAVDSNTTTLAYQTLDAINDLSNTIERERIEAEREGYFAVVDQLNNLIVDPELLRTFQALSEEREIGHHAPTVFGGPQFIESSLYSQLADLGFSASHAGFHDLNAVINQSIAALKELEEFQVGSDEPNTTLWKNWKATNLSWDDFVIENPQYENTPIPAFRKGTNFVPNTGLALVHRGEKIIPAKFNNSNQDSQIGMLKKNNELLIEQNKMMAIQLDMMSRLLTKNNDVNIDGKKLTKEIINITKNNSQLNQDLKRVVGVK